MGLWEPTPDHEKRAADLSCTLSPETYSGEPGPPFLRIVLAVGTGGIRKEK